MLFSNIKKDLARYSLSSFQKKRDWLNFVRWLIFAYGFQATVIYRLGYWASSWRNDTAPVKIFKSANLLVYGPLVFLIRIFYGINISRKAKIGSGLYIGHFGNIKLGKCVLGDCCSIQQSVHIENVAGCKPGEEVITHIGSRVWIGGHVRIHPGIEIGDNVTISAGSVVLDNVPDNCLVVGNPGRIINKNYDNSTILGL